MNRNREGKRWYRPARGEGLFPSGIRFKFMALFLIFGVIPLVGVGLFSYKSASNALLIQTREQLGNLADKTAQQVDTFFERAEKDIRLLSRFPFIQLSFLQFEFGQRLETSRRLVEAYMRNNPYYHRIRLVGLDGIPILSVPGVGVPGDTQPPAWFDAARDRELYLSGIRLPESIVVLTRQVRDFQDRKRLVGFLVFEIRSAAFTSFVSSLKIGSQGYAFLLDANGRTLYHPDQDLDPDDGLLAGGDRRLAGLVEKMRAGKRGFGECRLKGENKFMVFTPCQTNGWSVGITLQQSEFMADILRLRRQVMTFSALAVALITGASLLFARSLTRPIRQLTSGARAIGQGNLDQAIQVSSSDELRELAREFNSMAARLRKSMQEIVELKNFSDDILRSVSSGIITVDQKGGLTSINKSAKAILSLAGSKGEAGREGREAAENPGLERILALLKNTLERNEKIENRVSEYASSSREPMFVEINTSLLNDSTGRVTGAIADIRNVTLRKQMESLMVRVDKLASLGELSAGIAHEIRNPLAGMKTSIQVLAKKIRGESQEILIRGVLSEIDRLNDIVTDLLKFSGHSPSFPGPVDITSVLDKCLDLLGEKLKKRGIRMDKAYGDGLPMAFLDREQIQQVFLNLMLNAVNAMPEGGVLTISATPITAPLRPRTVSAHNPGPTTEKETPMLQVVIKDTGTGIKAKDLSRVFNPFFTTDPNGTGLGLPIAHRLLERNHADIFINSTPGRGCRVTLILPMAGPGEGIEKNGGHPIDTVQTAHC